MKWGWGGGMEKNCVLSKKESHMKIDEENQQAIITLIHSTY